MYDVFDWCQGSLYSISDQTQLLEGIPCSVSEVKSQIAEVEVTIFVAFNISRAVYIIEIRIQY